MHSSSDLRLARGLGCQPDGRLNPWRLAISSLCRCCCYRRDQRCRSGTIQTPRGWSKWWRRRSACKLMPRIFAALKVDYSWRPQATGARVIDVAARNQRIVVLEPMFCISICHANWMNDNDNINNSLPLHASSQEEYIVIDHICKWQSGI